MILSIFFALCTVLATVATYTFSKGLSHWWVLPIAVGYYLASIVVYLLVLYLVSLLMSKKKPIEKPKMICRFFIVITMRYLMSIMGARIRLIGKEKLPKEPCVLVSNHLSAFDPMLTLAALPERKLAYISKESNLKIPIVGAFIHHAGFHAIDRENGMRALRTLKHAAEVMQSSGIDMGIYPEGTRSRTGELLEFKTGAFLLAKRSGAPLVIMTTKGSADVPRNFLHKTTDVELEILEVLDTEKVKELSIDELSAYVRGVIEEALKK